MNNVADLEPCLILGCTIDPNGMKFLVRNSVELRLEDYKKSFNKWIACSHVKKLIFVENSGYDLTYFKEKTKSVINIEIEFLSTDENNFYPGELAELSSPFILRDVRGQSVIIYPVQYNPVTKILRIYNKINIEVKSTGISNNNSLSRNSNTMKSNLTLLQSLVHQKINTTMHTATMKSCHNCSAFCPLI